MDLKIGNKMGRSFGGETWSVPIERADEFWKLHEEDFSDTGKKSFLSSLGIPKSYWEDRNPSLKYDLIADTKHDAMKKKDAEDLFILVIEDSIQYVAPFMPESLGWEDPTDTMELDTSVWMPILHDLAAGIIQYVYLPAPAEGLTEEMVPAVFLSLPIFYHKPVRMSVGGYCVMTGNLFVDGTWVAHYDFRPGSLVPSKFIPIRDVSGKAALLMHDKRYSRFFEKAVEKPLTPQGAKEYLDILMDDPKPKIPRRILKKTTNHMILLLSGKNVPNMSAERVENYMDLFDTALFYTQDIKNMRSRIATTKKILDFFAREVLPEIVPAKPEKLSDYLFKEEKEEE